MEDKYNFLMNHGTWTLADKPRNKKIIKCKWVYKINKSTDDQIMFKDILGAKGFNQVYEVDYKETFSPVTSLSTIRLLIAFALKLNLVIEHLNVETEFLNGDIDEGIYMEQPDGFV